MFGFSSGVKNPWGTTNALQYCQSLCGRHQSDLIPLGLQSNLWEPATGKPTIMENGGGTYNNQHSYFSRLSSCLQCPNNNPNQQLCSSVEPSQWCTLTRKLRGVKICLICSSKEMSHNPSSWRVSPSHIWPQGLYSPAALKLREGLAELITCKAKPMDLFNQRNWGAGQFELRHQRALLVLELLLPLQWGRKTNS